MKNVLNMGDSVLHNLAGHGVKALKEKQLDILTAIQQGQDLFVALPTGFGKSLIYQAAPFLHQG